MNHHSIANKNASTAGRFPTNSERSFAFSVLMAVQNGIPFLPESVESILNQTFESFEFIIIDDGSTDSTNAYLKSLRDPRIKLIEQAKAGQHVAAHQGIVAASSCSIARMDSDDIATPERLKKQVRYLDKNAAIGLVGSQITGRGQSSSGHLSHFPTEHVAIVDGQIHNRHSMCNPSTMFRQQLYFDVGGHWQHNIAEDWDLFLRLSEVSRLANLDEPLFSCRFHTESINGKRIVEAQLYNEYAAELARLRHIKLPPVSIEAFISLHQPPRFSGNIFFYSDCDSLGQYRKAVAELNSGKPIIGGLRDLCSVLCSPPRGVLLGF